LLKRVFGLVFILPSPVPYCISSQGFKGWSEAEPLSQDVSFFIRTMLRGEYDQQLN
jgi:hypothetical protein